MASFLPTGKGKGQHRRLGRSGQALSCCPASQPPSIPTPPASAASRVPRGCAACPCPQLPTPCLLTGRQLSASFYNPWQGVLPPIPGDVSALVPRGWCPPSSGQGKG